MCLQNEARLASIQRNDSMLHSFKCAVLNSNSRPFSLCAASTQAPVGTVFVDGGLVKSVVSSALALITVYHKYVKQVHRATMCDKACTSPDCMGCLCWRTATSVH